MTTIHRSIVPEVAELIQTHHPDCSIILIGSVARGEERPDSDLDLNIFLNDDLVESVWATQTNRWQLQVIRCVRDVRIDVAWETLDFFETEVGGPGPFWILSCAEIVRDPSGRVDACLERVKAWTKNNEELCRKMENDFRSFKRKQIAKRRQHESGNNCANS